MENNSKTTQLHTKKLLIQAQKLLQGPAAMHANTSTTSTQGIQTFGGLEIGPAESES